MRSKKARTFYWSTYGAQLLCIPAFTLTWLPLPVIPLICFLFWLLNADSVHISVAQIWTHFVGSQLPRSVGLVVLVLNILTVLSNTFLVISSLTRLLFYLCITAFWTREAQEKSERFKIYCTLGNETYAL